MWKVDHFVWVSIYDVYYLFQITEYLALININMNCNK
jgi:hypothetical protein